MIYFIKSGDFVKIGMSTDPAARANELQNGNPHDIEMLGVMDGGKSEEKALHKQFASFHHRGEWFNFSDEIQAFIAEHCKMIEENNARGKALSVWVKKDVMKQIKSIALEDSCTIQSIMSEALNYVFEKNGKPRIA